MKIELENVLPSEIEKRSLKLLRRSWETGFLILCRSRSSSVRSIPVRISNMRILCAFQSMRWKKHWMRCVKALVS